MEHGAKVEIKDDSHLELNDGACVDATSASIKALFSLDAGALLEIRGNFTMNGESCSFAGGALRASSGDATASVHAINFVFSNVAVVEVSGKGSLHLQGNSGKSSSQHCTSRRQRHKPWAI